MSTEFKPGDAVWVRGVVDSADEDSGSEFPVFVEIADGMLGESDWFRTTDIRHAALSDLERAVVEAAKLFMRIRNDDEMKPRDHAYLLGQAERNLFRALSELTASQQERA